MRIADGGFEHGGWTMPYWHDDIGKAFMTLMQDVDAFLPVSYLGAACGTPAGDGARPAAETVAGSRARRLLPPLGCALPNPSERQL